MNLEINVIKLNKTLVNNKLSVWDASGGIPLGWNSYNVTSLDGGNHGYLCRFNESSIYLPGSGITWNSYIEQEITLTAGTYKIYYHHNGALIATKSPHTANDIIIFNPSSSGYRFRSITLQVSTDTTFTIRFSGLDPDVQTLLDFVSIYPQDYSQGLEVSEIDTTNIIDGENLILEMENKLFGFVSDSFTFEIFDDGNPNYLQISDIIDDSAIYRFDLIYNNGITTFNKIYFTDNTYITESTIEGKTIYTVTIFEITSFFKSNGWYVGDLVTEYDLETNEIIDQKYLFYNPNTVSIDTLLEDAIASSKRFLVADHVPIDYISRDVDLSYNTISATFTFYGKIVDVYISSGTIYLIIVELNGDQSLYYFHHGSVVKIITLIHYYEAYYIRFADKGNYTLRFVYVGYNTNANSTFEETEFHAPGTFVPVSLSYATVNASGVWEIHWLSTNNSYTIPFLLQSNTSGYLNLFCLNGNSNNEVCITYNDSLFDRINTGHNLISNNIGTYEFDGSTHNIEVYSQGLLQSVVQAPASLVNGDNLTEIDCEVQLISEYISGYRVENKTLPELIRDLAIIQNAYYYFDYNISGNGAQLKFISRESGDTQGCVVVDDTKATFRGKSYETIDLSIFQTETYNNSLSMKRSLIAYYQSYYGNNVKIYDLTIKELLDINIGDHVSYFGGCYLVRKLEQEIGYKRNGELLLPPTQYIELMEVL
jgi:hypothetical protein